MVKIIFKKMTQNWFVFQPMDRYLKIDYTNYINYILSHKFKELSDLEIDSVKTVNYMLNPYIDS